MTRIADIAAIEAAFEPWSRGEFGAEPFATGIEFVTDYPERQVHTGIENMARAWADFTSAWSGFSVTAEEIMPLDDGRHLVLVTLRGQGVESGIAIEQAGSNIVVLDNDRKIKRFELYFERSRGLEAADLA